MYKFEPLSSEDIFEAFKTAQYCLLTVVNGNQPYCVPTNYQWKFEDGRLWFLIFSNESGKKMDFIKGNKKVCLQFQNVNENNVESVIADGKVFRIEKDEENESMVFIEILATKVSGRTYTINNNAEGECTDEQM